MATHLNRRTNSFVSSAKHPTPAQVRALLEQSGKTQLEFGELVYRSVRAVEDWLSGQRRMPPDSWELIQVKLRASELMKRGRIAPQAVKDLGLQLPDAS